MQGGAVQAALMRTWQLTAAGAAAGAVAGAAGAAAGAAGELKCSRLPELSRRMASLCATSVLGEGAVARGAARQETLAELTLTLTLGRPNPNPWST